MKRILIIGGSGFIGSNLVNKYIKMGCKVSILDRLDKNRKIANENVKFYYGNLYDEKLIESILVEENIDHSIHLASKLLPSSDLIEYINEVEFIIKPTIKMLPIFSKYNVKLIYFSSGGAIYGRNKLKSISENENTEPITYYGMSKLVLEEAIKFENRKSNLSYLIFRPSNPYGMGQDFNKNQGLIGTSINNILNNKKITIWGDGSVVRDYIFIDDLVNIAYKIIDLGENNETFNIGSGVGYSVSEILDILKKVSCSDFEVVNGNARIIDVEHIVLDVKKSLSIYKDRIRTIEEGVGVFYNQLKFHNSN
jgi:UDP-glucose 4-epimerase